ncbi:methionine synthase [Clostridium oceanicum]|uniref:Methionine synthase n=1 Tax=Clostridium oceanicum TaxID=1543 RepID=A0ABP3UWR8_9CLOT
MNDIFKIDKKEVLRYLGYKSSIVDKNTDTLIEECRREIKEYINFKYTYKTFNIEKKDKEVLIKDTNLIFKGKDILRHLSNSKECTLMAVTLGISLDRKIALYEKTNMTKSIILDACATTAIEDGCDFVESIVKKEAELKNNKITFRYSPGYGDLSIEIQKDFLKVLNAQREIGLTASSHNILIPRKSVTAIIGFIPKEITLKKRSCVNCNKYKDCEFRKTGESCGN